MGNRKGRRPVAGFRGRARSSQRGRGGFEDNRTRQIQALREQARSVQLRLHDLNRRIRAVEHGVTPSNLKAFVNPDRCVACGTCEEMCPVCAIYIEEIARVDQKKCIGCGSCVAQCPRGAIVLTPLEGSS